MTTSRHVPLVIAATAAVLALAGCGAGTGAGPASGSAPATSAPGVTTPAPGASAPATAPSTAAAPAPSDAASPSTPPAAPSTSPPPLRSDRCTAGVLSASLTAGDGGAAGSMLPYLVLTNTGTARCTLQGWPGVSFVGDGNGTQLGAAGTFDRSSPHGTVTLDPGKSAHAPLRIAQALNYPTDTCQPVTADGLRVYPPGETHALFVPATTFTACRDDAVQLITVQALLPGSS